MGRIKKYVTVGLEEKDLDLIKQTMEDLGVNQGAAVRILMRRGARGPAQNPFTPIEGDTTHAEE